MLRFFPNKTKIVFFDLEYYVPAGDRERRTPGGMTFSPVLPGHKIIGGSFLTYYPMEDRIAQRIEFWEWDAGSERELLRTIFNLLVKEWQGIEGKERMGSLMLSGIGISHSDVPALLAKFMAYEIAKPSRIFDVVSGCRQIDLSTATYCQFAFNHIFPIQKRSRRCTKNTSMAKPLNRANRSGTCTKPKITLPFELVVTMKLPTR